MTSHNPGPHHPVLKLPGAVSLFLAFLTQEAQVAWFQACLVGQGWWSRHATPRPTPSSDESGTWPILSDHRTPIPSLPSFPYAPLPSLGAGQFAGHTHSSTWAGGLGSPLPLPQQTPVLDPPSPPCKGPGVSQSQESPTALRPWGFLNTGDK